jgi:hypothetical protein
MSYEFVFFIYMIMGVGYCQGIGIKNLWQYFLILGFWPLFLMAEYAKNHRDF